MRLRKFKIKNFKGIEQASYEWDDIIVLIGENNVGKSTVLQALECFLSGSAIKEEALFHNNKTDADRAIELVGYFDGLSDREKKQTAVQGRMHGDEWILKKAFWKDEEADRAPWKEKYYSYSSEETFRGWPTPDRSWGSFPDDYQTLTNQIKGRSNAQTREQLKELVREHRPDLIEQSKPRWIENPGGGGNWKSNANSLLPRCIFVQAVHDASDESVSKAGSAYGQIIGLIVEMKLSKREEFAELHRAFEGVLKLFTSDREHPEQQAEEIKAVQDRINDGLAEVVGGKAVIYTEPPEIREILMPSTTLRIKDGKSAVETLVQHQGHGLQRTLILTMLQVLTEVQSEPTENDAAGDAGATVIRPVVLAVEEPELYMHPQMARKMRDVLYRLAEKANVQVVCTTHSPVFLDMARKHRAIVRVNKDISGVVTFGQAMEDLFAGPDAESERQQLDMIARFDPAVNELFFAKRVVLLEGRTEFAAIRLGAEVTGIFGRFPHLRHDVTLIDCTSNGAVPLFQTVLNHFEVPYLAVIDEDPENAASARIISKVEGLLEGNNDAARYLASPNFEGVLGYDPPGKHKPYKAVKQVEKLHAAGKLPEDFIRLLNNVYFGQDKEP